MSGGPFHQNDKGGIMKNVCSRIGFGRPVAAVALAISMGFSGAAHAVIDYGNTIESITTTSTHGDDGHGTSYSSTTATVVDHAGVFDSSTGLTWIKATSLEEGQAQGYRPATASEFGALLLDKGWTATPGSEGEWSLTAGLTYSTSSGYSGWGTGSYASTQVLNRASVTFAEDASLDIPVEYHQPIKLSVTLGWLDGGAGNQVGGWFDRMDSRTSCSRPSCYTTTQYSHDAVVADLRSLQSGAYESANHSTGSNWSAALGGLPQTEQGPTLMYFMVAVPEPGTQALMGLGLAGLLLVARRRPGI
jgi:hypothetical protein